MPAGREEPPQPDVLRAIEEHCLRGLAVAARAPDLLVVRVERLRDLAVEHPADVGLVDPHAEGGRGDDHLQIRVHEPLLHGVALAGLHAGVVGGGGHAALAQRSGELLGLPARRDVDDPRLRRRLHRVHQRTQLALGPPLAVEALDREPDVGPVEAAHEHGRIAQPEPLDDLLAHRRRRRRGEGEDRGPPERLRRRSDAQVLGPEVVAPFGDAVRLVDHQQRRMCHRQLGQHVLVGELLGGQEQELERILGELGERPLALGRGQARVDLRRAARGALPEVLDLVALEGDQRRDDDRRALDQQPGDLVDRRLAGAGRHHDQRVAAREHGLDRLTLARSQRLEPERLARDPLDPVLHGLRLPGAARRQTRRAARDGRGRRSAPIRGIHARRRASFVSARSSP